MPVSYHPLPSTLEILFLSSSPLTLIQSETFWYGVVGLSCDSSHESISLKANLLREYVMLFCASESLQPLPPCFKYTFSALFLSGWICLILLISTKMSCTTGVLVISETICTAISDVINLFTFHTSHRNLLIYILIDFHLFSQPNYILNEVSNLVCILAVSCTCRCSTVASCFLLV